MSIPCWPNGHASQSRRDCYETIPDSEHQTMTHFGWGFSMAPDAGSPSGEGAFYACAHHRTDIHDDERGEAIRKMEAAKSEAA